MKVKARKLRAGSESLYQVGGMGLRLQEAEDQWAGEVNKAWKTAKKKTPMIALGAHKLDHQTARPQQMEPTHQ